MGQKRDEDQLGTVPTTISESAVEILNQIASTCSQRQPHP